MVVFLSFFFRITHLFSQSRMVLYSTFVYNSRWTREASWSIKSLGWGKVTDPETSESCLLLGQQSISQPRPACLQGLRPAFIPHSAAKADTPPGHEERGMHSDPPPSSPLSLQRSRDGGPFMESVQDPRHQIPVFHPSLYLLTLCAFVRGLFAAVEYTLWRSHSLPEGHGGLGGGH